MQITSLDYHTAGEPLRIVTGGLPEIPGETMLEKRNYMRENLDGFRKFLMLEPRGHADMYGAVLTPPVTTDGDVGVLFMHNEGYSTMCGHGIIAMVTAGLEHGLFEVKNRRAIQIDSPAGRISARAHQDPGGRIESVSFLNVPSFVLEEKYSVSVDGRNVDLIIAFGGAFYAYVDATALGFHLVPAEAARLIEFGQKVKNEVNQNYAICHPDGDEELNFLYGTIFVHPGDKPGHSRNACIFAGGELDRSPTGTGVSGRCAIHFARGEIGLDEELHIESIIGTSFTVRCKRETMVGDLRAVIPEVTGSAHISGEHRFFLDPHDPLQQGFFIR